MSRLPFRHFRNRALALDGPQTRAVAVVTALMLLIGAFVPGAQAAAARGGGTLPGVNMYGYAAGPREHVGSAAGRAHYVSASATRAKTGLGSIKGHRAPVPDRAPPAIGTRMPVTVAPQKLAAGHRVVRHRDVTAKTTRTASASGDDATYSVASTYDTVPMADQSGRIAVTLTNSGSTTWDTSYALGTQVFSASDTTGTGTPITTGPNVAIPSTTAPGGNVIVESVTPPENPGSYTICFDMVNGSGQYFSAEGATEYCTAYTIQQYPPTVNEQEPLPGTDVNTQTPQLTADATIPGGYPANPQLSYAFAIISGPNLKTASEVQSSGWVADNGNSWSPSTALTWGNTYYWTVTATDGATTTGPPSLATGNWTTPISFVVGNSQPQVGYRFGNPYQADDGNPVMTSDLGSTDYSGSGKQVDPKTANVAEQATDANVATVGPTLSIVRTYNSLDPRTSQALGAGWSSTLDMSLDPDPDGSGALILTLADGQQVRFAKNAAGGYAPPQDMYAVVSALANGGFSVTDQSGTTYSFGQASGSDWLISAITDASGRSETFTYSSGTVAAITSTTSGRALHLTWSTPGGAKYPHVATVSTDPVTAGQPGTALVWTYGYSGDLLTSVCPPGTTTACTKYGYITNGSHAPTSVLNANPTSYYRLDDPANATSAANQIPVNDLTKVDPPADEFNTTPGVAGPIAGASATSFNGTSSFIPLDGVWCQTPGQVSSCVESGDTGRVLGGTATSLAISLWFKTTATSGALAGISSSLPGSTGITYGDGNDILLQIASNGDLQGYGTCAILGNSCTWMSSPTPVNDGAWHQAVLIPGHALYLDGKEVATYSGGSQEPSSGVVTLGTGTLDGKQWDYFSGSLADLSIYQNQLPSVGTVAAQYAAETTPAAELSSITSPAGHTEMSATYDTAGDRVATLTDAHGGTWTYGEPVSDSTSAAYADSVLGAGPEDFWPLNDTTGPTAQDMIDSSPTSATTRPAATYTNVTLGTPGPTGFADGTAASFSGNGSQISIPGNYFGAVGAESVSLWFQTQSKDVTLFSASGSTAGEAPLIWIGSTGCVDAQIGTGRIQASCGANNGKWHQLVLTFSGPRTSTGLTTSTFQTATLYVDGKQANTSSSTVATASPSGYVAYIGNGSATTFDGTTGDFTGSIADVSLFTSALTTAEVTQQYQALQASVSLSVTSGLGQTTTIALPTLNSQTIAVTNPVGKKAEYVYADGNLIRTTDVLGGVTWYGYDSANRANTITDPDGDTTYTAHDAHNNVTSTTTCAAINDCQTVYTSYYEDLANPLDPRNDKPTDDRDARSSSPYDPAYDTVSTYTAAGLIASKASPPTAACPSGCKTSYTYTTGTEPAVGGGTEPTGLLASVTAAGGGVTSYQYDSAGDVAQVTSPLGLVTTYTHDNLGREASETQVFDSYPNGLTTSFTYDGQNRVLTETDPPVTDRVTGTAHTKVTTYTYDPDGDVLTTTVSDATGRDPARVVTDTYDSHGNLASVKDPLGNVTSYTYDGLGDKLTQTNPAGVTTSYTYDAAGNLLTTVLDGYTGNPSSPIPAQNLVQESRAYDPAGRLASVTNVLGTTTDYRYYGNNHLASSAVSPTTGVGSSGPENEHTYSYDAAGNQISQTAPGGLVTDTAYNADNQVTSQAVDPAGADRVTTNSYDAGGDLVAQSLSGGGVTQTATMTYNVAGGLLSQAVHDSGGNITTSYKRDQRGLIIAETDPDGNTTTFVNDEAGRPVVETGPAVPTQTGPGGSPVTANPVITTGYDTFGDETESSDADGNITKASFNTDGQQTSLTDPSYTPPGASSPVNGVTTMAHNNLGELTSQTDPDGNTTSYTYDQLGDKATETDPGSGTWTYTYDPAGQQLSVTDPTGAQTQSTYDNLGQLITTTDLVRQNTSAAYTTTYGYDGAGNRISQTTPTGVQTTAAYNPLGEEVSSTDGAGNTTSYAYNLDGSPVKETLPDGTAVTASYDPAGRQTAQSDLNASGSVLRTESASYDPDGNVTSATDFGGNTSTFSYGATGELLSATQPVSSGSSITVSYGYDLNGNRTTLTNGNGNTTHTTYNSLGLPETVTEPPTAQDNTATTTDSYDGDGKLVTQNLPGGVQVNNSYDAMGDLTSQSGSGASAPTATRTFTYDAAGRMLTAATGAAGTQGTFGYQPATSESFSWDDRGLLLAAAGTAGATSYRYNGAGQETSITDAAGTSSFGYDPAGRLATDTDAASGATGTYSYNNLGQVTSINYGTGNDTQSFGYDSLHRITSDAVTTASGAAVASIGYGYDASNNVTSMTTTGLDTASGTGTVTSTYGYDQANRLTSWTSTPSGGSATTKTYGYDNDGNLTNNNGVTQTYNARDELTSDSNGNSYTYTADGDLLQQNSPGNSVYNFSSDAYGQQITDGFSAFSWDALNRVVSATQAFNGSYNVALTYDGLTNDVASDPSATYSRDPAGQITGVDTSGGGKTIALVDAHSDLSGTFTAAGTTMASSATWDPWGQQLATTGPTIQVGYQGQWTDPVTGQVNMGSRMYRAPVGGFINSDTYTGGEGGPAVTDDSYAYAADNPMTLTDPSGHSPSSSNSGSGGITEADVQAAKDRADAAEQRAATLQTQAAQANAAAAAAQRTARAAAAFAIIMNTAAAQAENAAAAAAAQAAQTYQQAQYALSQAQQWYNAAVQAYNAGQHDLQLAAYWLLVPGVSIHYSLAANQEFNEEQYDENQESGWYNLYQSLMSVWQAQALAAAYLKLVAIGLAIAAFAASLVAVVSAAVAVVLAVKAKVLDGEAAAAEKAAAEAEAEYQKLAAEYQAQQRQKPKKRPQPKHHPKPAPKPHPAPKPSPVPVVCVVVCGAPIATGPIITAPVVTAPIVGPVVGPVVAAPVTGPPVVPPVDIPPVDGPPGDGQPAPPADSEPEPSCGGASFAAGTKVLLASGAAIPISQLKPGDKVLATNTKTGRTQPETVTAVLMRHDSDLYDLRVKYGNRTAAIDTTSNHMFWVPGTGGHGGRWVKAGALKYGTHLRMPSGAYATDAGGWVPRQASGWMWDLTVPGGNDHDFYIDTVAATVLVHNETCRTPLPKWQQCVIGVFNFFNMVHGYNTGDTMMGKPTAIERVVENPRSGPRIDWGPEPDPGGGAGPGGGGSCP